MGVFCGFEEFSDLEKRMHESTGMLALLALWTMTNVCLWHLGVGVTLIYIHLCATCRLASEVRA